MPENFTPITTGPLPARNTHRRGRRFIKNLMRMSSSSLLAKYQDSQTIIEPPALPRSASCGDLDLPGPFSLKAGGQHGARIGLKLQMDAAFAEFLEAKKVEIPKADHFENLPDELKIRIFGYLRPKELVRASLVSNFYIALLALTLLCRLHSVAAIASVFPPLHTRPRLLNVCVSLLHRYLDNGMHYATTASCGLFLMPPSSTRIFRWISWWESFHRPGDSFGILIYGRIHLDIN